jgi:hypothetical protein
MNEDEQLYNWRLGNVALWKMKENEKLIQEQKVIIKWQRRRIHLLEKKLWETK